MHSAARLRSTFLMDVHGVCSESKGVFSGSESELEENYSILQWVYRDYSIFYWQEFIPNTHFNLDCTSLFSRSENNTDCTFLLCSLDFHSKLIHSSSGEMGYSFLYHPYTFILPLKAVPQPLISCPPPSRSIIKPFVSQCSLVFWEISLFYFHHPFIFFLVLS